MGVSNQEAENALKKTSSVFAQITLACKCLETRHLDLCDWWVLAPKTLVICRKSLKITYMPLLEIWKAIKDSDLKMNLETIVKMAGVDI